MKMEIIDQGNKTERILGIYSKLCNGLIINKREEAEGYAVNERTIQRDIDDIRAFLDKSSINTGFINSVVYDYSERGYRLE